MCVSVSLCVCASGSVIQCFGLGPSSAVRLAEFGSWLCHFAQINLMSQYHSFDIDKMGMLKELHRRVAMSKDVALLATRGAVGREVCPRVSSMDLHPGSTWADLIPCQCFLASLCLSFLICNMKKWWGQTNNRSTDKHYFIALALWDWRGQGEIMS